MWFRFASAAVRFDFLSRRFSLRFFAATDFVFLPPLSLLAMVAFGLSPPHRMRPTIVSHLMTHQPCRADLETVDQLRETVPDDETKTVYALSAP